MWRIPRRCKSVRAEKGSSYLVGPLARVNLNYNQLSPAARQAADDSGITWPCFNPYAGIVARAIELVHACEESLQHIDSYAEPEPPRLEYTIRAGGGMRRNRGSARIALSSLPA